MIACVGNVQRDKMSSYSSELLQEKLSRLNSTQESIETLSLWIIHHKQYASTSISTWMEDMKSGMRYMATRFVNNFKPILLYNVLRILQLRLVPEQSLCLLITCTLINASHYR